MADPRIKIKRGIGKPPNWNGISGTTAGELYVDLTNTSFYIGNTFGQAITFGHFVDGGTLGTNSDLRVPTQKAAKTYIDAKFSSVAGLTSSDIIFVRNITQEENLFSGEEENGNEVSIGTSGTLAELNTRWESYNFNFEQTAFTNVLKSRGNNSIFKMNADTGSVNAGIAITQTSASSIKAFVSYQLSFDNFTNNSSGNPVATGESSARRCAIKVITYTDSVNYTEQYLLPSYGYLTGTNVLILNGSGIIEMPRWNSSGTIQAGVGYIELVWGVNGLSSINPTSTLGNNYRYAGRSTTNATWAPNNVTVGDLEPGYAARLIVAKLPL